MKIAIYRQAYNQCEDVINHRRELCQRLKIAQENQETSMVATLEECIESVDYALSRAITAKYIASRMIVAYRGHNSFWSLVNKYCELEKRG